MRIVYKRLTQVEEGDVVQLVEQVDILSNKGWPVKELLHFIYACAREGSTCGPLTASSYQIDYPSFSADGMTIHARDIITIDERGY